MKCQKHLFTLSEDITYLNGAYMSPQLKSVSEIGITNLLKKEDPSSTPPQDFFSSRVTLKKRFAQLIGASDYTNTAIIPSVSYGIANAATNIKLQKGDEIILVEEQFPSNYYSWKRIADQKEAKITLIKPPKNFRERGKIWNESILAAINSKTACIAMAQVHWADGTLFDLKAIREKSLQFGAKLIIDATQSLGAYPFSIQDIPVDAVICGGYKWLLGPYSLGMAYYNDSFNDGIPIEENWMNRMHSEDFSSLTRYESNYQDKASRYSVGESSNFILTPMLTRAIEQLIEWQPAQIQKYAATITTNCIESLQEAGYLIEDDKYRASHLFGIYLTENHDMNTIKRKLAEHKIYVSYRGEAIRVSAHIYNEEKDLELLSNLLTE
ncbi:aminotransferase class V-fold PLP-dependent enzyme [Aquimarina brevivitae]|uniref:Selenocysteine lyase/cysteine desulfurase n=1 Tax=Aquimarina brevivitae TaxID=323412 RepID=A0A4Q7PFF2_9FLAO|nr:aminotransferase class V-fold PLP-dependent enzyme [Aquimarina brevivitae]RZS99055.1 selenocysteine lyase/cysteine desulfurase [Aquimarina brevivitae]